MHFSCKSLPLMRKGGLWFIIYFKRVSVNSSHLLSCYHLLKDLLQWLLCKKEMWELLWWVDLEKSLNTSSTWSSASFVNGETGAINAPNLSDGKKGSQATPLASSLTTHCLLLHCRPAMVTSFPGTRTCHVHSFLWVFALVSPSVWNSFPGEMQAWFILILHVCTEMSLTLGGLSWPPSLKQHTASSPSIPLLCII